MACLMPSYKSLYHRLQKWHYVATCLNPKMKSLKMLNPADKQSTYDSLRCMMAEAFESEPLESTSGLIANGPGLLNSANSMICNRLI
jgi:hypothetical protein